MTRTILALAFVLAVTAAHAGERPAYLGGYTSPQQQLGETVAREMQRLMPMASDALARRIAPPAQEGREAWKARLQAEDRQFCLAYPDDMVCGR